MTNEMILEFIIKYAVTNSWETVVVLSVALMALGWVVHSAVKGIIEVFCAPFNLVAVVYTSTTGMITTVLRGYPTVAVPVKCCSVKPKTKEGMIVKK